MRRDRASVVLERCERLAGISEERAAITRPYGSPAMREVNDLVSGWMREAGMTVKRDPFGNLIGFYEGSGKKTLVLGSHLDTVRDAGRYDGTLGIMVALACVEELRDRGERLPYSVEVVAFADEEGLRFGATLLGSAVYAGAFDAALLDLEDDSGVTLSRRCAHGWRVQGETPAVRTDPHLTALLERAVEDASLDVRRLVSGAGHDAAQLAALTPVAMLFVRCEKGISHHPAESVDEESVDAAIRVLGRFLALPELSSSSAPGESR